MKAGARRTTSGSEGLIIEIVGIFIIIQMNLISESLKVETMLNFAQNITETPAWVLQNGKIEPLAPGSSTFMKFGRQM